MLVPLENVNCLRRRKASPMTKALKYLAIIFAAILLLLVAASVILVTVVDPNDYKPKITQLVQAKTGRQLSINGNLRWSFFPWLGIRLEKVSLGNPTHFDQSQAFMTVQEADFTVRLLPLLTGQVKLGNIVLHTPTIHLMTNAQKQNNWGFSKPQTPTAETNLNVATEKTDTKAPSAALLHKPAHAVKSLSVNGVEITNGTLTWKDTSSGKNLILRNIQLISTRIGIAKAFPLRFSFDFKNQGTKEQAKLQFNSNIYLDPSIKHIKLEKLLVNATVKTPQFTQPGLTFVLKTDADINAKRETLTLKNLNLQGTHFNIKGNLSAEHILSAPQYQGNINLTKLNLKKMLVNLGQARLRTKDRKALTRLTLKTPFNGDAQTVNFQNITGRLDNSLIKGQLQISHFKAPQYQFKFAIDRLNLDNYSPRPLQEKKATNPLKRLISTAHAKAKQKALLPIAFLRSTSANGLLTIKELTYMKAHMQNVAIPLKTQNKIWRFAPITAKLYGGGYQGDVQLNASQKTPSLSVNESVKAIQVGPLLHDTLGQDKLTGTASLSGKITTRGNTESAWKRNMNGNAKLNISKGAFKGVDLHYEYNKIQALLGKKNTNTGYAGRTSFGSVSATATIKKGIAYNNDLLINAVFLRIQGKGQVNFINEALKYELQLTPLNGKGKPVGITIPLSVVGSIKQPRLGGPNSKMINQLLQQTPRSKKELKHNVNQLLDRGKKSLQDFLR